MTFFQPNVLSLATSRSCEDEKYLKGGHPWVGDARCVLASAVASIAHHPRLVEGHPELHTVPKGGEAESCIVQEGIHHTLILPPSLILQGLGQVGGTGCLSRELSGYHFNKKEMCIMKIKLTWILTASFHRFPFFSKSPRKPTSFPWQHSSGWTC